MARRRTLLAAILAPALAGCQLPPKRDARGLAAVQSLIIPTPGAESVATLHAGDADRWGRLFLAFQGWAINAGMASLRFVPAERFQAHLVAAAKGAGLETKARFMKRSSRFWLLDSPKSDGVSTVLDTNVFDFGYHAERFALPFRAFARGDVRAIAPGGAVLVRERFGVIRRSSFLGTTVRPPGGIEFKDIEQMRTDPQRVVAGIDWALDSLAKAMIGTIRPIG
jgi:hypothetical protein